MTQAAQAPFEIPPGLSDEDEMRARFEIRCRRCGGTDIALDFEHSYSYSEYTQGGGSFRIGCNSCGQNDQYVSL